MSPLFDEAGRITGAVHIARDITEKKRAEEALKESRNYLDGIINAIGEPVFVKDSNRKRILLNDAYCQFVGRPREELVDKSDYDLFMKSEADLFRERDDMVFGTGIENVSEETVTDSPGRVRAIVTKKTLYSDQGGNNFLVGVVRDITEKKKAEEDLRASEERYRTVIETANEAIFVIQDERVKFFNPQLERLTGYSREELMQLSFADVVHPDDLSVVFDRYRKRLVGERLAEIYAFRFIDKQKNARWVEVNAIQISWDKRPATLNFLTDISERKQAEDRLTGLNTAFTRLTPYYTKNIALLTETCGKLIGATIMLYNKIEGENLFSLAAWNTPPDFVRVRPAECSICGEVIRNGQETGVRVVRNLEKTPYYSANPNIALHGYRTYIGYPVHAFDKTVGSLCAFFEKEEDPGEPAQMMLGIIASAISVEEERELAEQELKSREAILEAINFAAETLLASPNWETTITGVLARIGAAANVDRVVIFERKPAGPVPGNFSSPHGSNGLARMRIPSRRIHSAKKSLQTNSSGSWKRNFRMESIFTATLSISPRKSGTFLPG